MDYSPKLSIIVASYNHEAYIGLLIESILNQTFRDFEVLIIDDGSTDNSKDVIQQYKYDPRVKTAYQANHGIVYTRNKGISETTGRYVCFVDSDDILLPERFQRQINVLDSDSKVGIVYSDAYLIDRYGKTSGRFSKIFKSYVKDIAKNAFLRYCFFPAVTVMFRREVFLQTGLLKEPDRHCEYFKWIEMSLISKVRYIPAPLACWRIHAGNLSRADDFEKTYLTTLNGLKELLKKNKCLSSIVGQTCHIRYSRIYFLIGFNFALRKNDFDKARYYFKRAIAEKPSFENVVALCLSIIFPKSFVRFIFKIITWYFYERRSKYFAVQY